MWSSATSSSFSPNKQINYGVPNEIGMMGFRDMFVLAPAASFQYGNQHYYQEPTLTTLDHTNNIPLLSASPCIQQPSNIGVDECREIQFCQTQQQLPETSNYFIKNPMMIYPSGACGIGTTACRDCGNQAKKGCSFKRCRTCCKSRGFDCSTHVKSTWVPAARRRERQLLGSDVVVVGSAGSSQSINSGSKKPKVVTSQTAAAAAAAAASHGSTSNTTPPTSFESGSSNHAGKLFAAAGEDIYNDKEPLPGQVRAPVVFKCVRVTAVDDGDDEYAYQATVIIGGHVFKGFLYDQGAADQVNRDGILNISDLHLGGGERRDGDSSSMPAKHMLHSSNVYGFSGGPLVGGVGGPSSSYLC